MKENLIKYINTNKRILFIMFIILIIIISLFLGYAAGRAYKTYEITLEKNKANTQSQNSNLENTAENYNSGSTKEIVNPNVYAPRILGISQNKKTSEIYSININTLYFKFADEVSVDIKNKIVNQNTGFAKIYINNKFYTNLYKNNLEINIASLQSGTNTITVTLNANNGNTWWSKKGTLEAKAELELVR